MKVNWIRDKKKTLGIYLAGSSEFYVKLNSEAMHYLAHKLLLYFCPEKKLYIASEIC